MKTNRYDPNQNPHYTIGYMAAKIETLLKALETTESPVDTIDKIMYDVAIESATEYMKSYEASRNEGYKCK